MRRVMTMLGVVTFCSAAMVASAAQTTPASTKPAKMAAKADMAAKAATSVTGCVAAGTDAKHYTLTADDKTVYDLSGAGLKAHVGHKVEVTGVPGKAKAAGGNAPLHAKAVKMVAASCS